MKLSVFKNNNEIEVINLDDKISESGSAVFFIGRGSECYIKLDDRQVSREHAKLVFENNFWTIKNISSLKNSIKINGIYQEEKKIEESDFINIGPYEINISGLASVIPQEVSSSVITEEKPAQEPVVEEEVSAEEEGPKGEQSEEVSEENVEEESNDDGGFEENDDWNKTSSDDTGESSELDTQGTSVQEESTEFSDEQEEEDPFGGTDFQDEGDFSDGGFEEASNDGGSFGVQTTGGSEDTQEIKLAEYYLHLEGEFTPFNKLLLDNGEILVGRNPEKCQIILNDPEVSGEHLKITKTKVSCVIEDLGSSNGTLMNGEKVKKVELLDGDSFQVGSSLFTLSITSDFLESQKNMLMPVEENQEIEVEEIVEVATTFGDDEDEGEEGEESLGESGQKKSLLEQIKNDPVKKKRAIMIGGVLVLLLLFMDTDPPKDKKPNAVKKDEKIANKKITKDGKKKEKPKFKPEQKEFLEASYLLSKELFQTGKYRETLIELQKIFNITKDYKNAKQIYSLAKQGLAKLEELERKRKEEIERKKRERRVQEMVKKAREATDKKNFQLAKNLFTEIMKLDPENYDVPQMKLEIDAFEAEKKRKEEEERRKVEVRNKMVAQLAPSKKFYMSKDWYRSIIKLQQFLQITPMDDDLVKEATTMLENSKNSLNDQIIPLLAKARSLGEGEDLKGAYEIYSKVLFHDPGNSEAIEEMGRIKELLHFRAMKIYRHAIISESLSLFDDAKEKFQEVQQISPTDSEYYKKATEKLSEYIE